MAMNWAYIAGFFDGEGNVGMPLGYNSVLLNLTQAGDRGEETLIEIAEFLSKYNIRAKVRPRPKIINRQQCYMLWVTPTTAIPFLERVLPYLRIKRTISQDVIRARTLFPSLTNSPQGLLFRREHVEKINASRRTLVCPRGHVKFVGPKRSWCRECLKQYYKNKKEN